MEIVVTNHAVERYLDRIKTNISFNQARWELIQLINNAERTDEKNNKNHHIWKSRDDQKIKFILKEDKNMLVCTTLVRDRGAKFQPKPKLELELNLSDLLPPHLR